MSRFTVLEFDGVGVAVSGPPLSVGLVLGDAQRHGESAAWFLGADGSSLVALDPDVPWEVAEVDRASG